MEVLGLIIILRYGDINNTNYIYKIDIYLVNIPFILNNLFDLNISIKGINRYLKHLKTGFYPLQQFYGICMNIKRFRRSNLYTFYKLINKFSTVAK